MATLKVEGLDKLEKALKSNVTMNDVKQVVRQNGSELNKKMVRNADFTRGYATGTTKRSIHLEISNGGFEANAGPTTEYAPYVEYGTRFMDAQPFVRPAYEAQKKKFLSDMQKLTK